MNEQAYIALIKRVLERGVLKQSRVGDCYSLFGETLTFSLRKNKLPLLTTRSIHYRSIVEELLWFLRGDVNIKYLQEKGVTIWDKDTKRETLDKRGLTSYKEGDVGPSYGFNWRHFGAEYKGEVDYKNKGFDQIVNLIDGIKQDPFSRRHILTSFNPQQVHQAVLPPCHLTFQICIRKGKNSYRMTGLVYMRSSDIPLGLPFNIASYATLLHILCKACSGKDVYKPEELKLFLGDAHIYANQKEGCLKQMGRKILEPPTLEIKDFKDLNLTFEQFVVKDYVCGGKIKFPLSV